MKPLWTIAIAALLAGLMLSACSRQHSTPYHGVATDMNFGRQVINPKAPDNPELPAEVSGPIGESIFKRRVDTYGKPIPDCLFTESCSYGTGPSTTTTETTTTE
jgi:ABC-type oligopeptide transport system substrate-binding subunit